MYRFCPSPFRVLRRSETLPHLLKKQLRSISTAPRSFSPESGTPLPPATAPQRKEGDISSVFPSLSGLALPPLPSRIADQKLRLLNVNRSALVDSWNRLLRSLKAEIDVIAARGPAVVPTIDFKDVTTGRVPAEFGHELRKRGVCVVRGVVGEEQALNWKEGIRTYLKDNPGTKEAFPPTNPSVYELYFSPSQLSARANLGLLEASKFLMSYWHSISPSAPLSLSHPLSYADRLRIRPPGDAGFALGPHVDSGSVERWEDSGYGLGHVFSQIWNGEWEQYDPWEASCRLPVNSDLYNGAGSCSMFRTFQGWMSMSETGPGEGTLLVNPLFGSATAYMLLRPFFKPVKARGEMPQTDDYLTEDNWVLEDESSAVLQGAACGQCQELNDGLHPHLELAKSMVHVPKVKPGDFVAWHCDTIHAVDKLHNGISDSSVMYIPVAPLTENNARYLMRQREAFHSGHPGPDFPGGVGEAEHTGRVTPQDFKKTANLVAQRAMGLVNWDCNETGLSDGQKRVMETANVLLRS
ncbi:MAG: hypothetical protein M1814_005406 [Vezdaea aestivalis]|nr:MAG: hypothetical protein M1814_005406 [Vezdaea aestivalis]